MVKKILLFITKIILHLAAAAVIFYFFLEIARWYFDYPVILGVDFFNTVSHVSYLLRNFALRAFGYRYIWWGGIPMYVGTPDMLFYLILPLIKFFNIITSVKLVVLAALFLFLFFSYLLFNRLSKNPGLSVVLAIFMTFSLSLYGALVWGGGLLFFSAQLFLPLVLYFAVGFLQTKKIKQLLLAGLLNGISMYMHPQLAITLTFPMVLLMLLFTVDNKGKFFSGKKFSYSLVFLLVSVFVGYFAIYGLYPGTPLYHIQVLFTYLVDFVSRFTRIFPQKQQVNIPQIASSSAIPSLSQTDIVSMRRTNIDYVFQRTYPGLFIFFIVSLVLFIFGFIIRRKIKLMESLSYLAPFLWSVVYLSMFLVGMDFYHGGIYRAYWYFTFALGLAISFFLGRFQEDLLGLNFLKGLRIKNFQPLSLILIFISIAAGYFVISAYPLNYFFKAIEIPKLRQQSSAYPEVLNTIRSQNDFDSLRKRLVPDWLPVDSKNYRLYEADQRVSLWWNTFFDLPLVTGYLDMPLGGGVTGSFYWISSSLTKNDLVENWKVPVEVAKNNALYLLDWFSIKYLELGHVNSDSFTSFSSYIDSSLIARKEDKILKGWIQLYELPEWEQLKFSEANTQDLNYFEIKDELVSPVLQTTNAKTIGIIAPFPFYETVFRAMAITNINSKELIPVFLGDSLDNLKQEDFSNLDALFLYGYKYSSNNIWEKLDKYVKNGGKLLIETGSEVKETSLESLPAVFPVNSTKKAQTGESWSLKIDPEIGQNLSKDKFAPPFFENKPWQFSQGLELREGAKPLLSQKNIPLIVAQNQGTGKVIWSGMNLTYHAELNHNLTEGQLFRNLLLLLTGFEKQKNLAAKTIDISAEKAVFEAVVGRGVLFREQNWKNWHAKLKANNQSYNLKVYSSGPAYPGFLYVKIPDKQIGQEITLEFSYGPTGLTLFYFIFSIFSIILVLDYCFLGGKIVMPIVKRVSKPLSKIVTKWWDKDEDEDE